MALPVFTPSTFSGWIKIVANEFKETDLQEYIDLFTPAYIRDILGDAAFIDIRDEDRTKWTDLLEGVDYIDSDGKQKVHNGINDSLTYFIYFEFVRDNFTSTQTGKVQGHFENSNRSTDLTVLNIARSRYNQGVRLVCDTTGDFLEANKEILQTVTSSTDNADNTYTLFIPNTKYLIDGDTVEVLGIEYTVSGLVTDTSIVIDAGETGLDFTGQNVTWEPYKDVEYCEPQTAGI